MELLVLDKNFSIVGIIDQYESFNWTDRYNECGEFELTLLADKDLFDIVKTDYYLYFDQSEKKYMIIEGLEIKTDYEKGNRLIVTGRSLESILDRRIIWSKTRFILQHNFQNSVLQLITNAFLKADNRFGTAAATNRQVTDLVVAPVYDDASGGPLELKMKMDAVEYWGENIYEIIVDLCKSRDPEVGFKIIRRNTRVGDLPHTDGDTSEKLAFSLYIGTDRSSENTAGRQPVIFSPYFENISDTDYYESVKTFKTTCLIVGQDKTNDQGVVTSTPTTSVYRGKTSTSYKGLYRREVFCDASNIPRTYRENDVEKEYDEQTEYKPALQEEGRKLMSEDSNRSVKTFEGEVDYRTTYVYGVDYFLGDIVDVADIFGHEIQARITEVTFSDDEEGFSITPTFSMFDEEINGDVIT